MNNFYLVFCKTPHTRLDVFKPYLECVEVETGVLGWVDETGQFFSPVCNCYLCPALLFVAGWHPVTTGEVNKDPKEDSIRFYGIGDSPFSIN